MNYTKIINGLLRNKNVFRELLSGLPEEIYLWKPNPEKWCLLEIICHLYDEEKEDFNRRIRHVLETPTQPLPPIDPSGWVESRHYLQQNYHKKLNDFLVERAESVRWLRSLSNPEWNNMSEHSEYGKMTASRLLANWLAHDFLHIRQITKVKYDYLIYMSNDDLDYAGNWEIKNLNS